MHRLTNKSTVSTQSYIIDSATKMLQKVENILNIVQNTVSSGKQNRGVYIKFNFTRKRHLGEN